MITVTDATLNDIPDLAGLLEILFAQEADFAPDRDKQTRALAQLIASPTLGQVFVVRVDGRPVAMVSLLFTISTAEGGPACLLEDLVVHPDHRGRGFASALLDHAAVFAKDRAFTRITVMTDPDNAVALAVYERHGFRRSAMTPLRLRL